MKFVQFSLTFCSFLAVLGVIILRYTRPELPRPYRVWAYPLPPLLFLAMSLFMMIYLLREQPREALIGVGIMLTGCLIYPGVVDRRPLCEGKGQLNRDGPVRSDDDEAQICDTERRRAGHAHACGSAWHSGRRDHQGK